MENTLPTSSLPTRLFPAKRIFLLSGGFLAALTVLNRLVRFFCQTVIRFDCPTFWPLSIFVPRLPDGLQLLHAGLLAVAFGLILVLLRRRQYRLAWVIPSALVLLISGNLLQGYVFGLEMPISGCGPKCTQYYHDSLQVISAADFLRRFSEIQPRLFIHGRTHPPGAVLLFYGLRKIHPDPAWMAVLLAAGALALSLWAFHHLLSAAFPAPAFAGYLAFLLSLVPAVQIYYLASLDALLAGLLLAALAAFLSPRPQIHFAATLIFLGTAFFLSFGSLFLLPVLAGFELLHQKSLRRFSLSLLLLVLCYALIYLLTGFNYPRAFFTAAALENPAGFYLFADPASYLFTRLEGAAEIILFLGPFLSWLALRALRQNLRPRSGLVLLSWLGLLTLAGMLLTGAFRTGETARVCLFVYPYLLFPAALHLQTSRPTARDQTLLAVLVFGQSWLMQLFGFYFW